MVPVVALPGWFIERKKMGQVVISNGRDAESVYLRYSRTPALDAKLVQRIAHPIEAKCRNIVPNAYGKSRHSFARR